MPADDADVIADELGPDAAQSVGGEIAFPVVGVVVSQRSIEALAAMFAQLPLDLGAAFVLLTEAEEGVAAETMIRVVAENSRIPARLAIDGVALAPGTCLVAPDQGLTTVLPGQLLVIPDAGSANRRGAVDTFLISLAEHAAERAVAILLSGVEGGGSLGFARIREQGGLTLFQSSAEIAVVPSPFEVGGPAGLADAVLDAADIPARLSRHLEFLAESTEEREAAIVREGEARLPTISTILRQRTGHDFHGYKAKTFLRRIQRRMHVTRVIDIESYVERLRSDADEVQHLFQDLLIGVTQFFRDPLEFEMLGREVIPQAMRARAGSGETLRIWVLGCATGEEAYSIAILVREAASEMDDPPAVQIFATDIDARALTVARTGRYPASIETQVTSARLRRWFLHEGGTYRVQKELREMCIFSAHNIIKDAPFSRIDLVSCRNLLIYLKTELQDRVIPLFHFALRPGGHLFLGPSENVRRHAVLFQPIDRKHRIFRRQETATRVPADFPLSARVDTSPAVRAAAPGAATRHSSLARQAERALERYAPAYVIIDEDHQVLQFSGRTGPFLEPSSGVANLNLMNLVHRELRLDLQAALHRASVERRIVTIPPVVIGEADGRRVGLTIEPLPALPNAPAHFIVLFHDEGTEADRERDAAANEAGRPRDDVVQRLESVLRTTKDRLQATIEELESTAEELKASNEEYQSINEELQSANEELETSKEELQSVNEELQTVNGELAHRVSELAHANSDLKNLLESTQIATVFLDNDLRVKSFTPSMSEVFHLLESDVGRPIAHIASRVPYGELEADVRRVLRTLATIEREIGDAGGRQFLVRVLPYRSVDNFIAGAVLTFLDVTESVRAQGALRVAEERLRMANAAARIVAWQMEASTGQFLQTEGFDAAFGTPAPVALVGFLALLHPDDRARAAHAFEGAMARGEALDCEVRFVVGGHEAWVRIRARTTDGVMLGVFQDVDERRRSEAQRELLMAELQHRVKNILALVSSVTARTLRGASTLEAFASTFSGRIDALARTQSLLANRGAAGIGLEQIIRDELAATVGAEIDTVRVDGPHVDLRDRAAETFTLALHELVTNAAKHGALARPGGRVSVVWQVVGADGAGRLSLRWEESGVTITEKPSRSGFGRQLIERGLPYDLGASTALDFTPTGVHCIVELPLGPHVTALAPHR